MPKHQALLTRAAAADYLSVSTRTLDRWRREGLIATVKVGGVVRFRREDLDALVEQAS